MQLSGLLIWDGPFLARLNGPSSRGLYGPLVASLDAKQQTGVAMLFRYIIANGPSMAHQRNAERAIFGSPGICKWEGLTALSFYYRIKEKKIDWLIERRTVSMTLVAFLRPHITGSCFVTMFLPFPAIPCRLKHGTASVRQRKGQLKK